MKVRIPERPKDRPYIIDAFLYYNERDLLDLRLRELDDAVDIFVLVQANRTHAGVPHEPPLIERERLVCFTADLPEEAPTRMRREEIQRNAMKEAVRRIGLEREDIVMFSDVDEIPNKAEMDSIMSMALSGEIVVCNQMHSYFKLNLVDSEPWYGTTIVTAQMLQKMEVQDTRCVFSTKYRRVIDNGGWHFGWMGGNDLLRSKLSAFSHGEFDTEEFKNDANLDRGLRERVTLHNGHKLTPVPLSYLPGEVRRNPDRYKHLLLDES